MQPQKAYLFFPAKTIPRYCGDREFRLVAAHHVSWTNHRVETAADNADIELQLANNEVLLARADVLRRVLGILHVADPQNEAQPQVTQARCRARRRPKPETQPEMPPAPREKPL